MRNYGKSFHGGTVAAFLLFLVSPLYAAVEVTSPPDSFHQWVRADDREAATRFYAKYVDVGGMPVVAAKEVDDEALRRTHHIVTHMLAGRPDVLAAMVRNRMYLIIIGRNQVYTDMPEYRNHPNPAYQNERVRGTGGRPTSFGEENLLGLPIDRYDDESIGVHEFCHTIDSTLRAIDDGWAARKSAAYQAAMSKGLWRETYAASNPGEFWAEICQSYFDCNRVNNWNHGPIGSREQLKIYDPASYELVRQTFKLDATLDWRYTPLHEQPQVVTPPEQFQVDPFYTKFTWAREFTVLGRGASDEALLQANRTIRNMFAYRHDILKALIADGMRLVVLGKNEAVVDLPEYRKGTRDRTEDRIARVMGYQPDTKLLVVGEENVAAAGNGGGKADDWVVREFAAAIYHVVGQRPVDPNWENRGRAVQQYELRVKRLDSQWGDRVAKLYESALAAGRWQGTPAVNDRVSYWVEGVGAYFHALGQRTPPQDARQAVTTREALEAYDPELYALVDETMAYRGHVDWRLGR